MKKNMTIDDLAVMMARGFDIMDKRFNDMDKRFDRIEAMLVTQESEKEFIDRRIRRIEEKIATTK